MRRQRLMFLFTMLIILVAIALIGSSSWLIVRKNTENNILDTIKTDTCPYFTSEYTYDGKTTYSPTVKTDATSALLGATSDYTITYLGGTPFNTSWNSGKYTQASEAINAGVHYFKIVETATGQVIANKHQVTVKKADATSSIVLTNVTTAGTTTAVANLKTLAAGFVGDTATWTITVKGVGNDGNLASTTKTHQIAVSDFNTFSANVLDDGNKYTGTYSVSSSVTTNGKHLNNYNFSGSLSYSIGVLPNCYTSTNGAKIYYGNLDQALEKTQGQTTALIAPQKLSVTSGETTYTFTSKTHFKHAITKDATIGSGVKFFIPHGSEAAGYEDTPTLPSNVEAAGNLLSTSGTKASSYNVAASQKNVVTIKANVKLISNGTIHIPGQVNGTQNGVHGASLTTGVHSQITMESNAQIIASNNIYCFGFIADASATVGSNGKTNGSQVVMNSGNIMTVYTVIEHRGGSTFLGMVGGIMGATNPKLQTAAFNRFYVRSVTANVVVNSGASLSGYADLYANDAHNVTEIKLLGSNNEYLVNLSSGSKALVRFVPGSATTDPNIGKNKIEILGSAKINSLSINVKNPLSGGTIALSTSSVMFPISYYLDITLSKGSGTSATVDSTAQMLKILPGGSLTVGEGVTLNVGTLAVYSAETEAGQYDGYDQLANVYHDKTPSSYNAYAVTTAGVLDVSGEINVTNLGGTVNPTASGAVINITGSNTVSSKELSKTDDATLGDSCTYVTINLTANGTQAVKSGSSIGSSSGDIAAGMYVGYNFASGGYGWMNSNTEFNLYYTFIGADGQTITNSNPTTYKLLDTITLATPTIADVTTPQFAGWFPSASCNMSAQIFSITGAELLGLYNGDATLYGKWTPTAYTLSFNTSTNIGNIPTANVAVPNMQVEGGSNFNPYNNRQINDLMVVYRDDIAYNRYFGGWYTDSAFTNRVDENAGLTVTANTTLYAKWSTKATVTFTTEYINSIDTIYLVPGTVFNPYTYDIQHAAKDSDFTFSKYFIKWTVGTTDVPRDGYTVNNDTNFTMVWGDKVSIIFNVASTYGSSQSVWVLPGSAIDVNSINVGFGANDSNGEYAYYLEGIYSDSSNVNKITEPMTISQSLTVYTKWLTKEKLTISVSRNSGRATPEYKITIDDKWEKTYSGNSQTISIYVLPGNVVKFVSVDGIDSFSATVNGTDVKDGYTIPTGTPPAMTVSITASCIAAGTEITLADGTTKKVEDILESDMLLVYDHERGEFVACPILFIERDGWAYYDIINLKFSDGTVNRLIYEHALFDVTLNRYVYITAENYTDFIGHEFAKADGENITTVTLEEAYMTYEYTGCFSLVTYYHLNYFIDGMFSIPGGIDGIFNMFEYGEDLKYDEEQMRKDIETYGLYTYEDFADYIPEEVFNMFQTQYFKIAVGKGHITYEGILELIDIYLKRHGFI